MRSLFTSIFTVFALCLTVVPVQAVAIEPTDPMLSSIHI